MQAALRCTHARAQRASSQSSRTKRDIIPRSTWRCYHRKSGAPPLGQTSYIPHNKTNVCTYCAGKVHTQVPPRLLRAFVFLDASHQSILPLEFSSRPPRHPLCTHEYESDMSPFISHQTHFLRRIWDLAEAGAPQTIYCVNYGRPHLTCLWKFSLTGCQG